MAMVAKPVVRLREFRLGSFVMHDVPAGITEAPQDAPLVNVEICIASICG